MDLIKTASLWRWEV